MRILFFFFPAILLASSWAEKTLNEMTLDEKIGQLFVAPACALRGEDHMDDWVRIMEECHVGNAILKQGDPISQVKLINRLQGMSKRPLLILADAEWGLAMRMSDTIAFPRNMTLGAIADLDLIYEVGREIGRQAKRVGIHINLAPVADVNNNPLNPIIHMRSFGENPEKVACCVSAFSKGMQEAGVIACAKHFPGHGDTSVDSHRDLPVIPHSLERLEKVEFVPFKRAIDEGIGALMSAHLYLPALDQVYPTSLSGVVLQTIAREHLGFKGLIISDALNMRALTNSYSVERVIFLARNAGCDLLLYGDHIDPHVNQIMREAIPNAFQTLKQAYRDKNLNLAELDKSVLRILEAKERMGREIVSCDNLMEDLHPLKAVALKKKLFQEAVTLVGDDFTLSKKPAYLVVGSNDVLENEFAHVFHFSPSLSKKTFEEFDQVVIAVHNLVEEAVPLINALSDRSILCLFTSPYTLKHFKSQKSVLVGYENDPDAQVAVWNVLQGKEKAKGHLPVTVNSP